MEKACAVTRCPHVSLRDAKLCFPHLQQYEESHEYFRALKAGCFDRTSTAFDDFVRRTEAEERNGAK